MAVARRARPSLATRPRGPTAPAAAQRLAALQGGRYSPPMAAILPILIFVLAVLAINWAEFGRPD